MKAKSLAKLKRDLDTCFSVYIRQRDMDKDGINRCVCCGATHHWKELQAGHYYRRQHLGTRWDERNVWPCCFACNVWRRGNYASYARFMYATYSQSVMDELDDLHKKTVKFTRSDLEGLIEKYRSLIL